MPFGSNNTRIGGRQGSIQTGDVLSPTVTATLYRGGSKQSSFIRVERGEQTCGRCDLPMSKCQCSLASPSASSGPPSQAVEEPAAPDDEWVSVFEDRSPVGSGNPLGASTGPGS